MPSIFDNLSLRTVNLDVGNGVSMIDPDTSKKDDERYRLENVGGPEVANPIKGTTGEVGANKLTEVTARIAREGGFNDIQRTGTVDAYGRPVVRQENARGESLSDVVKNAGLEVGLSPITGVSNTINPTMNRYMEKERQRLGLGPSKLEEARMEVVAARQADQQASHIKPFQMKEIAPTLRIAKENPDYYYAGAVHKYNTDRDGYSKDPFEAGFFDHGGNAFAQQWYGLKDIIGTTTGSKDMQDYNQGRILGLEFERSNLEALRPLFKPGSKPDITDPGSVWDALDIKSPGKAVDYLAGAFGQSLPYMIPQIAAAFATGGTSLALTTAPALMYTADTWNRQKPEDKSVARAFGSGVLQAVLDKVGLESVGILKPSLGATGLNAVQVLNKETRDLAINQLVAVKKMSKAEATKTVDEAINGVVRETFVNGMKGAGKGILGEGITEAGQEVVGTWGETGKVENTAESRKQWLEAGLGGGIMGGVLGGGTGAKTGLNRYGAKQAGSLATSPLSDEVQFSMDNQNKLKATQEQIDAGQNTKATFGDTGWTGNRDFNEKLRAAPALNTKMGQQSLSEQGAGYDKSTDKFQRFVDFMLFRGVTHQGLRNNLVNKDTGKVNSIVGGLMSNLSGPGQAAVLGGVNDETAIGTRRAEYEGKLPTQALIQAMKTTEPAFEKLIGDLHKNYWSKGLPTPNIGPHTEFIDQWRAQKIEGFNKMKSDAVAQGIHIPTTLDDIFSGGYSGPSFNATVLNNQSRIKQAAVDAGMTEHHAEENIKALTGTDAVLAQKARSNLTAKGVFSNPKLSDVFKSNQGILKTLNDTYGLYAKQVVMNEYWGKDGSNVAKALAYAVDRGELSEAEAQKAAALLKIKYDIMNQEFHKIQNEMVNTVYTWGVTGVIASTMGKAFFSNLVETMASSLNAPNFKKHISDTLSNFGTELKQDYASAGEAMTRINLLNSIQAFRTGLPEEATLDERIKHWSDVSRNPDASKSEIERVDKEMGEVYRRFERVAVERAGLYDANSNYNRYDFERQTKETHAAVIGFFTKVIMLNPLTNATKQAVVAQVPQVLFDDLEMLRSIPAEMRERALSTGEGLTREQRWALQNLVRAGVPYQKWITLADTYAKPGGNWMEQLFIADSHLDVLPEIKEFAQEMSEAMANLVNQKVVNPGAGNLPAYWNDPRMRPLVTLKRFVAAFTSVYIPRLYHQLFSRDSHMIPRMEVFSTMMLMVLMSYAANLLKDLITWGDEDKHRGKHLKRAIYGTSLLGPFQNSPLQISVETASPVFGKPFWGVGDIPKGGAQAAGRSADDLLGGLSPFYGLGKKMVAGAAAAAQGDTYGTADAVLQILPSNILYQHFKPGLDELRKESK